MAPTDPRMVPDKNTSAPRRSQKSPHVPNPASAGQAGSNRPAPTSGQPIWLWPAIIAASLLVVIGLALLFGPSATPTDPQAMDDTPAPQTPAVRPATQPRVAATRPNNAVAPAAGTAAPTPVSSVRAADGPPPAPVAISRKDDGFAITVELTRPQTVTVVIEDAAGKRVRNLISETRLPAGKNLIAWDGYDDGITGKDGDVTRTRVTPGVYRARGLVHDGVKTHYEFTVYGGGTTPWPTDDNTGGWLADHSSTLGATFIPSGSPYGGGKPQVLLVAPVAECGSPLVWVGTNGQTVQRRPLWGWDGGDAAATDFGAKRDPRFYAYILIANANSKNPIRVRGLSTNTDSVGKTFFDVKRVGPDVLSYTPKNTLPADLMRQTGITLSVLDGLLAFTVPTDDVVVIGDVKTGAVLGTFDIPAAKGVLLLSRDSMLVSTNGGVKRFALTWNNNKPALGTGTAVITGLEDPRTIHTDPKRSRIYVADWGKSNQVKVYDPGTFKQLLVIGQPGGLQVGAYNELQMQCPNGLAVDDAGQLWVAEADWMPKRVSIWDTATGALKRSHYGPPHYGGGGTIDPTDKTRFFYGEFSCTLEFKLDWKTGAAKLVAIPVRQEVQKIGYPTELGYGPEVPWHANGRTYLSLGYQTAHRANNSNGLWLYDDATKTAMPVSHVGNFKPWLKQDEKLGGARYDEIKKELGVNQFEPFFGPLMCWTEANGDARLSRDELKFRIFPEMDGKVTRDGVRPRPLAGFHFFAPLADLSLCGSWNLMIPPPTFRSDGVPVYDITKAKFMLPPSNEQCWEEDGFNGILTEDGFWLQGFKGYKDGKLAWTYPVDDTQGMPPRFPGQIVEPTRLMGPYFKMKAGEAGVLGVTNGERGNMYIMTSDGLFVQAVGGHRATAELLRFPKAVRGMDVSGYSFEDEHFHPTVTHTVDDEVYMVAGKEHSSIFQLKGLETVRRRQFGDITVTDGDLAAIPPQQIIPGRKTGRSESDIGLTKKTLTVDGRLDDWADATWMEIGKVGTGALAIRDGRLYAAWKTGNPKVLANGASDPEFAFKRGGAVDLMLGMANRWAHTNGVNLLSPIIGDQRLLFCQVDGRNLAVIYRQTAWGKNLGKPQLYESPIGKVQFADVAIITDQIEMAQADGNVEVSVPLKLLDIPNFNGGVGEKLFGDMGILRGSGSQTTLRTYWNNQYTAMISDIPTEAKLAPANWGLLTIARWSPVDPTPLAAQKVDPATLKPGLTRRMWNSTAEKVPQQPTGNPIADATSAMVDLAGIPKRDDYAVQFDGFITVPADGIYRFTLASDDGSLLWIDGRLVVDNDGLHGIQPPMSDRINLAKGQHTIRVGYLQRGGNASVELRWTPPGGVETAVPATVLSHTQK